MRLHLLFALFPLLAGPAPSVSAGTLHKCVDASGRIAFSDQPCAGTAVSTKSISTAPAPSIVREPAPVQAPRSRKTKVQSDAPPAAPARTKAEMAAIDAEDKRQAKIHLDEGDRLEREWVKEQIRQGRPDPSCQVKTKGDRCPGRKL